MGLDIPFAWDSRLRDLVTASRESEAQRLRAELEARGERFTVEALGLGTTNDDPTWSIFEETAPWFNAMSGAQVDPARGIEHENDRAQPPQVAWKQPFLYSCQSDWVLEWDRATAIADRVQPELAPLREALRNPTARSAWETEALGNGPLHSFVPLRVAAQGFHDLLQVELRRGTIDRAFTNLLTMARICQYHRETASLVGQMARVALTGLTVDAVWQALQAPGWSEARLESIQRELADIDLLNPLARTFEIERIAFLQGLARYREGGVAHLQDQAKQFGFATTKSGVWKQRLHHTHWRLFRYRDAELRVIREFQQQIDRARFLGDGHPLNAFPAGPNPSQPTRLNAWFDQWAEPSANFPILSSYSGSANFVRPQETAARVETERRLALVALALERFRLATGKLPATLEPLVPKYLESVPMDPFEGNPIHYEALPNARFALWAQDASGQPQSYPGNPLIWPAADPPLHFEAPPSVDVETQSDEVLPRLEFENAPLIDVIKMLARQAKLNLIIDPQVLEHEFPPVNIRLQNVTALNVLESVLYFNGLKLETDPRTRISRVTN